MSASPRKTLVINLRMRLAPALLGAWCCIAPAPALADAAAKEAGAIVDKATAEVVARHVPGSITSVASADAALADVTRQRQQVEGQYARDRNACSSDFFITKCLDIAHERHRVALERLRPIEVEAKAFKRQAKVTERDLALEEKRSKAEHAAANPPPPRPVKAIAAQPRPPAEVPAGTAPPVASRAPHPVPHVLSPGQSKPLTPQIDSATQARNILAFNRKAAEAAQRQHEIAEKKAEKERERARKRAAAAAQAGPATAP